MTMDEAMNAAGITEETEDEFIAANRDFDEFVGYRECEDALITMTADNVISDQEYSDILIRLKRAWGIEV